MKKIFWDKDLIHNKYENLWLLLKIININLDNLIFKESIIISSTHDTTKKYLSLQFLNWAIEDFNEKTEKWYNNSIQNSKKAIMKRAEEIIVDTLGLKLNNWRSITSILINDLQINVPSILKDFIIDPRNLLEHSFNLVDEKQSRIAYEIAELFLDSTEKYLHKDIFLNDVSLWNKEDILWKEWYEINSYTGFDINFQQSKKEFLIIHINDWEVTGNYVIVNQDNIQYPDLMYCLIKIKKKEYWVKELISILHKI